MKNFIKLTISTVFFITAILFGVNSLIRTPFAKAAEPAPAAAAANDLKEKAKSPVRPSDIKFSPEYGRITDSYDSGGETLIVHIQDAHTNYEAQKNSANILEELINKNGLYLILVEGGSRDVSLTQYRENAPMETRRQNADKSLKEGVIAGEEYLDIASDYPMKLQGIEDRAVYDQNMEAFLGVDKGKDPALAYARILSGVVSNLKARVFNKELKEMDEKRLEFKAGTLGLSDYVTYLNGIIKAKKINIVPAPPNYRLLSDSIQLEKTIDFAAVEKERADVIDILSKKIGQDELNDLLAKSVEFKAGKITQAEYHTYLKDIMVKAKLDVTKYPNLDRYIKYLVIYDKIDSPALFKELKDIEDKTEQAVSGNNEDQKRLSALGKNLEFLVDFINLKLSPDDFEYYKSNQGDFNIQVWARFLNSLSTKYKFVQMIPEDAGPIDKVMPSVMDYYSYARKRDVIFVDNAKKYMKAEGVNFAVLIAGGFHTPPLVRLLKENKISYVVISPKVVKPTDDKLYHKILTEGWAPAGGVPSEGEANKK